MKNNYPFFVSFILLVFSFGYFIYNLSNLVWIDFIFLFLGISITYYFIVKDMINKDFAKIFLAILLFLISYGNSEIFLRYILNFVLFYVLTVFILSLFETKKKEKLKVLKNMEYAKISFLILNLFLILMFVLAILPFNLDDPIITLFVVLFLLLILDYVKKLADPHINRLRKDDIYIANILLFLFLFLFNGRFEFVIGFLFLFIIKILIGATKEIKKSSKKNIESKWSLYNYTLFSLVFTLLTNKSIIEIIIWAFI